jgi:hypothetical protein
MVNAGGVLHENSVPIELLCGGLGVKLIAIDGDRIADACYLSSVIQPAE